MKAFVLGAPAAPGNFRIAYDQELNPEQLEVVRGGEGPCLVLAGAGSGKTRTITYRVAYLLEQGVSPNEILLVTFTNKAAKEMLSRVEGLLGAYPAGLWGGTFHSVANRILRTYAHDAGRTPGFTILDSEDTKDLLKLCVKELKVDTTARRFPSPANLYAMISYARNASRPLAEVVEARHPNFSELIPTIERVAGLYEARKREANAMDFDDLLLLLRDLLETRPVIRERLATQFRYVLVDEYQDTNVVQAQIMRALSSAHGNLLVVGDDAQSIYSFRAAEIRNILGFPEAYAGAKVFRLTTNYRSTPDILDVANAVISRNAEQFEKTLVATRGRFEKPNLVPAQHAAEEAQYIAEQVLKLREDGTALDEIAVLFRAAFHSQSLEFELMKRDIPYEYRGGMKFFERAHVKDAVAHLRLVANPKDEAAWMRVLGLQQGIGLVTAGKIFTQVRDSVDINAAVATPVKAGTRATSGWAAFLSTARRMLSGNRLPADMIRAVAAGGYRDYLEAEYPDFMDRLDDLEQFAVFAEGYDDLTHFLDEVSLTDGYGSSRESESAGADEKMILSTIHQAKGLEWDAVFVMNLVDGKFPNQRALDEEGGLEEERRLFYVAATRARKRLFLTYPVTSGYDTLMLSQPSVFLEELPEKLVERVILKRGPSPRRSSWNDHEPVIVLDDLGESVERPKKAAPSSFLRDIDEL